MFNAKNILKWTFSLVALFFVNCMDNSTEIPNGVSHVVSGLVVDNNNKPVSGAIVQIVPVNYAPTSTVMTQTSISSDTTDANGNYQISVGDIGAYNIECTNDTVGAFIDSVEVVQNLKEIQAPNLKLKKLGAIIGVSHMPGLNDSSQVHVSLYILGTNLITAPTIGGAFSFENVPEGTYQLILNPTLDAFGLKMITVKVSAGQTLNLDTVLFSSWAIRDSTQNQLFSVTWTGSQAVAVGDNGAILTSPDGINWTQQVSGTTEQLLSVVWTGNQLVVVGYFGVILTSPDGKMWSSRASKIGNPLLSVVWADTQLVAVGLNGTILTSPDGINWTSQLSGTQKNLSSIVWTGNQLVAVGDSGTVLTSGDGITWVHQISGTTNSLSSVAFSGAQILAIGNSGLILSSLNGVDWMSGFSTEAIACQFVAYLDNQFLAVGNGNGAVVTSLNGVSWTLQNTGGPNGFNSITWTGTRLVAVGPNAVANGLGGIIKTSP